MTAIILLINLIVLFTLSIQQSTIVLDESSTTAAKNAKQVQPRKTKFRVSWALYTGWIPLDYAQHTGILAKHAAKENIEIEFVEVASYMNSITKFVSREVDGFVAPINDLVALPMVEYVLEQTRLTNKPDIEPLDPISPVVVFVGSSSEGADAILSRHLDSIKQLKGQDVHLEIGTISQYFLYRALQLNNLTLDDVNLLNSALYEWVDSYVSGAVNNLVGFNPFISFAQEQGGGNILFTTEQLSREIVDVMVIHSEVLRENPGVARALTGAFYEVMDLMRNQSESSEIIQWMGERQNTTGEEFLLDMEVIELFYKPQECVKFLQSEQLKITLANSLNYVFDVGLLDEVYSNPTQIGVDINGDVFGDRTNIKIYFDDIFCQNEVKQDLNRS